MHLDGVERAQKELDIRERIQRARNDTINLHLYVKFKKHKLKKIILKNLFFSNECN